MSNNKGEKSRQDRLAEMINAAQSEAGVADMLEMYSALNESVDAAEPYNRALDDAPRTILSDCSSCN